MDEAETKKCSRCKETLPLDAFGIKIRKTGQLQAYCKPCTRANSREHYSANKSSYSERNRKHKQAVKDYLQELKESTPCADCGVLYPFYVMHFDHLPEYEKTAGISYMRGQASSPASLEKIKQEIEKCEIVCANCHAERTYNRLVSVAQLDRAPGFGPGD